MESNQNELQDDGEMTIVSHLSELRKRLISIKFFLPENQKRQSLSALLQLSSDKIKDRGSENQYKKYKCGPVLSRTSKKQPESQR